MRFAKNSEATEAKGAGPSGKNNIRFVKEDDPIEEENTVARSSDLRMGNSLQAAKDTKNIGTYN